VSVIEAVTVTLYRVKPDHRPKDWRKGKPRRQKALAYRDAAWAKLRIRCRCVFPDFDPDGPTEPKRCRYHDKEYRADEGGPEDPPTFWPPAAWRLPRSDEGGYWDYGRAVAFRLARLYAHLDSRALVAPRPETPPTDKEE
jgi:hypothetical protein